MKFNVIPNEQTPIICQRHEPIVNYIEKHEKQLHAFLEYAKTRGDAVGLAANQVAIDGKRFTVRAFALLNLITREWSLVIDPTITGYIGMKEIKVEGCLTWKGQVIVAERNRAIDVSYYDINGNFHSNEIYKGFEGQIWQHEINHLNGIEEDVRETYDEPPAINIGRNEQCPCGALDLNGKKKKYKKCCLLLI